MNHFDDNGDADHHSDYEGVGDDVQQQQQQQLVDPNTFTQHVSPSLFKNDVTRVKLQIDLTASPAELAACPSKAIWRMKPHLTKAFKVNTALRNRDMAGEKELLGNLNRAIILGVDVHGHHSNFPYPMGISIPGVSLDTLYHGSGSSLWSVPPGASAYFERKTAYEPVHVVNQWMYRNYSKCSLEDLQDSIQPIKTRRNNTEPKRYAIAIGSLAHNTLQNVLSHPVHSRRWAADFNKIDIQAIMEPMPQAEMVEVTETIANDLRNELYEPIKEVADSFINLDDLNVHWKRTDDHVQWDTPKGIVGAVVGKNNVNPDTLNSEIMQRVAHCSIMCEVSLITF